MGLRIEDYGVIGDTQTAALVGNDGSIDWLCLPRFDSGACFAALLGRPEHGRWLITPRGTARCTGRRYRPGSMILETELANDQGVVRIIDFMPVRDGCPDLVRIVEGVSGEVDVEMELVIRFDYGVSVPWVRALDGGLSAVSGPDALMLRTPVETAGRDRATVAAFRVSPGSRVPFELTWHSSVEPVPPARDPERALVATESWWTEWSGRCRGFEPWHEPVERSLLTLKALTNAPTGGIAAAVTTSLPEALGGVRNWDYRFCWLRDATFTLYALMSGGYRDEAVAWRDWLLRAAAGDPAQLRIMYGLGGERLLPEFELDWLPGYEGSRPVRIGNGAAGQRQLDVYGELMDAMHQSRKMGIDADDDSWALQRAVLDHLESTWELPDEGIWEVRGPRQQFTHSKVMCWVAFDRAVKAVERFGLEGPVERWRHRRNEVHDLVCRAGYDPDIGSFTQRFGSPDLDAAALMIPLVGFLPADDPRVIGTVRAVEQHLTVDGFVRRYATESETSVDGLPPGEGAFLACSFWLVDCLALTGRHAEARERFERLLTLRNDLGLLAEQYEPRAERMVGNFPQAFSHVALVNSAANLAIGEVGAADRRPR